MKTFLGFTILVVATSGLGYWYYCSQDAAVGFCAGFCGGTLILRGMRWTS